MNQRLNKYFDKQELTLFGICVAFKGTKGDIVLKAESPDYQVNSSEPILVELHGYLVPFFIEEDSIFYSKTDEISFKFDTVNTNTEASEFIGKKFYVLTDTMLTFDDENSDQEISFKYLNYSCYDQHNTLLGKITDVDDIPGNPLLIIHDSFGKEILVPVNAAEILDENDIIQTVKITVPEGLLDIIDN